MKTIGSFFLRARHWQLFSLFMGLYLLAAVFSLAADLGVGETFIVLWMLCLVGWIGSMGLFLNTLKEPSVRSRTKFYWFALIYPPLYAAVFVALFFNSSGSVSPWIIVPPNLLVTFCMLYIMYFAAKSLAMVEAARPVKFYDYAGLFFLIWFFPVGVWFVQPRINRLYAQSKAPQAGAQPSALQ